MNKIQLFSEKATYASPSSKLIVLQTRQSILLEGSGFGKTGEAGGQGGWYGEGEDEF